MATMSAGVELRWMAVMFFVSSLPMIGNWDRADPSMRFARSVPGPASIPVTVTSSSRSGKSDKKP